VEVLGRTRVAKSAPTVHAIAKVTRPIPLKSSQANKRISHKEEAKAAPNLIKLRLIVKRPGIQKPEHIRIRLEGKHY
jgi:hypothetical protein